MEVDLLPLHDPFRVGARQGLSNVGCDIRPEFRNGVPIESEL
jgi:hypothetical protein